MQKTKLFHLWTIFLLIIITFILVIYISIRNITGSGSTKLLEPKSESSFLSTNGFLIFIKSIVYPVSVWSSIIAPSFMLSVLAAVIGNEFEACKSDLENSITKKGNILSKEDLSKLADKFCDLARMVKRVDAMFSYTVALNLAASLGSLCVAVYYIAQGENVSAWTLSLSLALTVMILIPPLTSLNTKVSTPLADPGGGAGMRAPSAKI